MSASATQGGHNKSRRMSFGRLLVGECCRLVCSYGGAARGHVVSGSRRRLRRQLPTRPDVVMAILRKLVRLLPQLSRYCILETSVRSVTVTVTVTGTAGVKKSLLGLDSWIAVAEEVSLQTASEGGKRRCRRDVLRQTVPNTGCSDWKGPVADS